MPKHDQIPGDQTAPYPAPTFDTGAELEVHPDPVQPVAADPEPLPVPAEALPEPMPPPMPAPAQPVAVEGSYQYLKRWMFVLLLVVGWLVAAAIGVGLYYWWYHSIDKTPPVFVVLIYVIVSCVAGLITAMVQGRPLVSAAAIALIAAPFGSALAAAALYGAYVFQWIHR